MNSSYSKLINGVDYQLIEGKAYKAMLLAYADHMGLSLKISNSDYNQIRHLEVIKDDYVKSESIKRLTQKTIVNSWKWFYQLNNKE